MKPSTTVFISADEAVVYCNDPLGLDITPANGYDTEEGSVDIEVGGAARTLGFWKTHLNFTTYVFTNYTGSSIDLGWKTGCTARINRVLIGSTKGGGHLNRPLPVSGGVHGTSLSGWSFSMNENEADCESALR